MGSWRDRGAQTSPGPCCSLWDAPPAASGLCSPSGWHAACEGAFPAGTPRAPSPALPCLLCPSPGWGCPQPHEETAQAVWVRKRNNFVSKLGLDVIAAKSQKLSGQTPQKLGKLLSRTSENRRTLYKYHLSAVVVPCSYPASICVKNSKNKTSEN